MRPAPFASPSEPGTHKPRSRMFWVVLGALAIGQLFAFWLLCSQQVRKAQARHTQALVQQMALADCLQYIAGSTVASCSARIGAGGTGTMAASHAVPDTLAEGHQPLGGAGPVRIHFVR